MKLRTAAIHEAGHAILGHYNGITIKKISLKDHTGVVIFEKAEQIPKVGIRAVLTLAAGYMAQFMDSGESFWIDNPRASVRTSGDMQKLKGYDLQKSLSKTEFKKMLHGLVSFMSDPPIWGKVESLADEIRDDPEGLDDINNKIRGCYRERIPKHDPAPLIRFLADELYGEQ